MSANETLPQDIVDAHCQYLIDNFTLQSHKDYIDRFNIKTSTLPFKADAEQLEGAIPGSNTTLLWQVCILWLLIPPSEGTEISSELSKTTIPLLVMDFKNKYINYPELLKKIWELLEYALEDGRLEGVFNVLPRILQLFIPWKTKDTIDKDMLDALNFDIRKQESFTEAILDGLTSDDSETRKRAFFVLKATIRFSKHQGRCQSLEKDDPARLLSWDDVNKWYTLWSNFCLLYETIQETQVHLVEPVLPLLETLLQPDQDIWLGMPWWECIMKRAFANPSVSVRKVVLNAIIELNIKELPVLRTSVSFLFGPLLSILSNSFLYAAIDAIQIHSGFGDKVATFYKNFIDAFTEEQEKAQCIRFYMKQLSINAVGAVPLLFLVQPLMEIEDFPVLCSDDVKSLEALALNNGFHNPRARRLFRWILLQAFLKLADANSLSFPEVATTLHLLTSELDLTDESRDYALILEWFQRTFTHEYLLTNIKILVERALVQESSDTSLLASTMICFLLKEPEAYRVCLNPLLEQLAFVNSLNLTSLIRCCRLVLDLECAINRIAKASFIEIMADKLLVFADSIEKVLIAYDSSNVKCTVTDLVSVEILLKAFELLLSKCKSHELSTYLDMLCIKTSSSIKAFHRSSSIPSLSTYEEQVTKSAVFGLASIASTLVSSPSSRSKGLLDIFDAVLECELVRPVEMNDEQWSVWPELQVAFTIKKCNLLTGIARISKL